MSEFLPTTKREVEERGWDALDVIIISGDAYVDHPAFGHAVVARLIEAEGYRVAIVPQPNWRDDLRDFKKLGAPRLFFGISSGCMDPMVNHYTAAKRKRSTDAYTPGESRFSPRLCGDGLRANSQGSLSRNARCNRRNRGVAAPRYAL